MRVFETFHPAVVLAWCAGVVALSMLCRQPVLIGISVVCALLTSVLVRGREKTLSGLRWQVPSVALIAAANPLFSSAGSTEILRIGVYAIYAESLWYGLCSGAMLIASIVWLEVASALVDRDKLWAMIGGVAPNLSLVVSMSSALVPRMMERAQRMRDVERVAGIVRPKTGKAQLRAAAQTSSALLGWSLADTLGAADSMRSRGWGASRRRTSYKPYRFSDADAYALIGSIVLFFLAALCGVRATMQYQFYPVSSELVLWAGYVPYALYCLVAAGVACVEYFRWQE